MLALVLRAGLPLVHVTTGDVINVQEVLTFIAGEDCSSLAIPTILDDNSKIKSNMGSRIFYTSSDCKTLKRLYLWALENEKTIVFINTEKSVLQFDAKVLMPPPELVRQFLATLVDNPEELLPAFSGLTLKDVGEVAKLCMTRDESLTARGVTSIRNSYTNLKGITPIDSKLAYYVSPLYLQNWLDSNTQFFCNPIHEILTPRGLLLTGEPGTGKTMAAKFIANKFEMSLYHLDVSALKGKYVGDSETNLASALAQIDAVSPCVVLLDEIEKIFQSQGDSGVTSSLLSQLLWWLQERQSHVFVVMTTNDISLIPKELYRPGRIDSVMEFIGIESFKEGLKFSEDAITSLLLEMGEATKLTLSPMKESLSKTVKSFYQDNLPVPQTKLIQNAYIVLKQWLLNA
jgi:hypothetical protein